jgi:hypothetical protein
MISCLFLKGSRCSNGVQLAAADTFDLLPANRRSLAAAQPALSSLRRNASDPVAAPAEFQLTGASSAGKISPHNSLKERHNFVSHRSAPESGIQYPRGVK